MLVILFLGKSLRDSVDAGGVRSNDDVFSSGDVREDRGSVLSRNTGADEGDQNSQKHFEELFHGASWHGAVGMTTPFSYKSIAH